MYFFPGVAKFDAHPVNPQISAAPERIAMIRRNPEGVGLRMSSSLSGIETHDKLDSPAPIGRKDIHESDVFYISNVIKRICTLQNLL